MKNRSLIYILLATLFSFFLFIHNSEKKEKIDLFKKNIDHIVIVYLENRSFDNLFHDFPEASTPDNDKLSLQEDKEGRIYKILPPVMNEDYKNKRYFLDKRFPEKIPNEPFLIDSYVKQNEYTPDLVHRFYQNQWQINKGLNNKFAAYSDAGGFVMGYHDMKKTFLWNLAENYTLCDNFFQAAFGGSFLNHIWLIASATPVYQNAPDSIRAKNTDNPETFKDGAVTPDGFAVNTIFPAWPSPLPENSPMTLPPQEMPTIGDRLTQKNISWKWYAGGWEEALKNPRVAKEQNFQFHHQPFVYFKTCMRDTVCFKENLDDSENFFKDLNDSQIPSVVFYKPAGEKNQHPEYSTIKAGDSEIKKIIEAIQKSKIWEKTVIIITYDENGGFWDHKRPPKIDRWGPGSRIPAIIASPWAKKKHVDHSQYDTTSILKLIEERFDLSPLAKRDKNSGDLINALEF